MDIKSKEITMVSPKKVKPHPKNNNRHPIEQVEALCRQVEYQGFRQPLVVSTLSGFLVSGHLRWQVAKKLKLKEIPVIYQEFENEAQEYAFLTADNAIPRWAELDMASIKMEAESLGVDFDIDLLGIKDLKEEIENEVDHDAEWDGMPPFQQADKTSFRHVIVHFTSDEDAKEFFKRIGQNDTGITKSIWFPPQERMDTESKRYG